MLTDPACTLCPLHTEATSVCVPSVLLSPSTDKYGPDSLPPSPSTPAVVIIGQNPGSEEDAENHPFIPRTWTDKLTGERRFSAGHLLRNVYIPGISLHTRATIYLTNSVRCGPASITHAKPHNTCFRAYTAPDLLSIAPLSASPLILLFCSAPAVRAFWSWATGKGISQDDSFDRQAHLLDTPFGGAITFSTYHPAAVIRRHKLIHAVRDHLDLLSNYLDGTLPAPSTPNIVQPRRPKP